ncbi:MAG: HD-GYP domain-containing protein [Candidatus Thiodiazotropha endolucinida]
MIKQITTQQIRPGMYVHKLDCSWLDHPFARNSFLIKDMDDVRKLRGVKLSQILIDTEKGLDVDVRIATQASDPQPEETVVKEVKCPKDRQKRISVAEERQRAGAVKQEAERIITGIMADIKLGKRIDAERVSPVVEHMMGSVFRNEDALLGLTRIRQMDKYTFEHSVSVSVLLIAFAKQLGLEESTIRDLGIGGLLHDIGKMRVPDKILNKPGRLNDEEFAVIREHVNLGHGLVDGVETISATALEVVTQHHERIDGSGYPCKLHGNETGLYGKMAAVVDVYDAITSDRVYHKGQLPSVVLKRMMEWSGSHFDPKLVQHFIQCVGIYPVGSVVALESERLAIVIQSPEEGLLEPLVNMVYDLRKRRFITPRLLDLANQPEGEKDRILRLESAESYGIRPEVFMQ